MGYWVRSGDPGPALARQRLSPSPSSHGLASVSCQVIPVCFFILRASNKKPFICVCLSNTDVLL
ncbi:hypothetical protein LZ32DRAFT_602552 [Colletotrichum eremochloae]|nr:hypothetical protein LZ32DRAFT_602552 [Colletotrichum eremochloae]